MKKDTEVKLFMQARHTGATQQVATARRYERAGKLLSELKRPRTWRTRPNPFEEDWPWVVVELQRDPALQGTTLFALLCERHPEHSLALNGLMTIHPGRLAQPTNMTPTTPYTQC